MVNLVELVRQPLGWKRVLLLGKKGQGGTSQGGVFFRETGQFTSSESDDCKDRRALADGVIAIVVCAREPLPHFQGLGDQNCDHGLESHFLESFHFVFVTQTDEESG